MAPHTQGTFYVAEGALSGAALGNPDAIGEILAELICLTPYGSKVLSKSQGATIGQRQGQGHSDSQNHGQSHSDSHSYSALTSDASVEKDKSGTVKAITFRPTAQVKIADQAPVVAHPGRATR